MAGKIFVIFKVLHVRDIAGGEVVDYNHIVTHLQMPSSQMRTNKPSPARNQYSHNEVYYLITLHIIKPLHALSSPY